MLKIGMALALCVYYYHQVNGIAPRDCTESKAYIKLADVYMSMPTKCSSKDCIIMCVDMA